MMRVCRRCGNKRVVFDEAQDKNVPCPNCVDEVKLRGPGPPQNFQLCSPPKKRYYSQEAVHVLDRRGAKPVRTMCGDFIDDTWVLGRTTVKEPWNDVTCSHCIDKLRTSRDLRIQAAISREEKGE